MYRKYWYVFGVINCAKIYDRENMIVLIGYLLLTGGVIRQKLLKDEEL